MTHPKLLAALILVGAASVASAESELPVPPQLESFVILGAGFGPDYIGSDDTKFGVIPAGRLAFGNGMSATLAANLLKIDLLRDRNWSIGPAGLLRFGRKDVDNPAIDALPDIDMTIDLGMSVGYQWVGDDLRDRWQINGGILFDAGGDFDLHTGWATLNRWQPVGRFGALGLSLGTTWGSGSYMDTFFSVDAAGSAASGLPIFDAQSGVRDVRLTAIYAQPVSENWAIGGGFMYAKLLGDAKDSPVSSSDDQLYAGIGAAYAW